MHKILSKILPLIILCQCIPTGIVYGQDNERPLPPFLKNVTVDPITGFCSLLWMPGGSPDVAGYVLYNYIDGAGEAFDTIFNPHAISYIDTKSKANLFSVSYLVAAIDSSDNISPLSNDLNTLYIISTLDTCNHRIKVEWNSFNSKNHNIDSYRVYSSIDGSPFGVAGTTSATDTSLFLTSIVTGSEYCFFVEAILDGPLISASNRGCINTDLSRPPLWINGDFASVENGELRLSFSYDPLSDLETFRIEESSSPNSGFSPILNLNSTNGVVLHTINPIPPAPRYYRLSALNNCETPVISSNPLTLLITKLSDNGSIVRLWWNNYIEWEGGVDHYTIFRYSGDSFTPVGQTQPGDTVWTDDLYSVIYETSGDSICYRVTAYEGLNPYYNGAESRSTIICTLSPVRVYFPTLFTPDGDGVNDFFRPVISFTPKKYRLLIKSRSGATVFETIDYLEAWDGSNRGRSVEKDVYIWFFELETSSGREISRHGTITIF